MKIDRYLNIDPELGHKYVQRVSWFAFGFLLAYLTWGPK